MLAGALKAPTVSNPRRVSLARQVCSGARTMKTGYRRFASRSMGKINTVYRSRSTIKGTWSLTACQSSYAPTLTVLMRPAHAFGTKQ